MGAMAAMEQLSAKDNPRRWWTPAGAGRHSIVTLAAMGLQSNSG